MIIRVNGQSVTQMKIFYFCGRSSLKDFSYCKLHLLYAYQPKGKKDENSEKEVVQNYINKKVQAG